VTDQLILLTATAPKVRRESLPLDLIDGFENAAPSAKLRELIRDVSLLQPVVVVSARSGRYHVVEGRRRCKAIAQLAKPTMGRCRPPSTRSCSKVGRPAAARCAAG
jgi:hypothetical protein